MKPLTSLTKSSTESCAVDVDVPEELVRVYFSKVMISSKLIALHSTQKLKRKKIEAREEVGKSRCTMFFQ